MADTIKIPGLGPMNKKYAYIGAAGIAGFVAFAYYRSHQSGGEEVVDPAADPTAEDSTAFDPAYDYSAYSTDGGYMGSSPVYYPPYGSSTPPGSGNPTSDPEWNQAAYEILTNRGIESAAASHALSLYMANLCMTAQEADYVRQAIGAIGETPQAHHTIQICPGAPPPASGGSGLPPAPSGLKVTSKATTKICLAWTPISGVTEYHIKIKGPGFDHTVATHNNGTYCVGNMHRKSTYQFYVLATNSSGTGPKSATVSAKTK